MKKWLLALGGIVVLGVLGYHVAYYLFDRGIVWFVYPDREEYPIWGIDVSHHQGEIDWATLLNETDFQFVFLKATEADDWSDPKYVEYMTALSDSKVPSAPYHFYSLAYGGREQAEHFLATALWDNHQLPPVVDLEFGGNSKQRPSLAEFEHELSIFMDTIYEVRGTYPIIYATEDFYDEYLARSFSDCTYWMRNTYGEPDNDPPWLFWQYHSRARLPGVVGPIDLNVFVKKEFVVEDMPVCGLGKRARLTFSNTMVWDPDWFAYIHQPRPLVPDAFLDIVIPDPPQNTSATTMKELEDLHALIPERTLEKQIEIEAELDFATTQFGERLYGEVTASSTHPVTHDFLTEILLETTSLIMIYKQHFDRVRPHALDSDLTTSIEAPGHPAYPSGHSTQAHLVAHIFSDMFPEERTAFFTSAERIAKNREIAGVHYTSDSAAGVQLAEQYYNLLRDTDWYQEQLELVQAEWQE